MPLLFWVPYLKADGGTTSDTGKNSWGASSDRSDLDNNSRSNSVGNATGLSSGTVPDGVGTLNPEGGRSDDRRKSEGQGKKRGNMLFISGMMGVKRHCLGTLRCGYLLWSVCLV